MSSKLSIEELLSNLENRVVFHRDQEAFHAQQEVHHGEQRAVHAAELEKVLQNLEAFRTVAAGVVEIARPLEPLEPLVPPEPESLPMVEKKLPPPGRQRIGRFLRLVAESPGLEEPFSPTDVAEEANRRYAAHLRNPIGSRTASDVLRRMLAEGGLRRVNKGKACHEALYARK